MEEPRTLGQMLNCAAHLFRERTDARMVKYGTTPVQAHVILYLSRCGGQSTQQALGQHLRVKPSTVNGIVDRLAERGLVERSTDERDARRRHVTLTPAGAAAFDNFRQELAETERTFDSTLSPEELAELKALLMRIIHILEEDRTKC